MNLILSWRKEAEMVDIDWKSQCEEKSKEIARLRARIFALEERERSLENQLIEAKASKDFEIYANGQPYP
jgi:hypothetical protein